MPILELSAIKIGVYRSKLKSVIIEEILKESLDFASIRAEWQILKFRTILKPSRIEEIRKESLYFATEAKNDLEFNQMCFEKAS